MVTGMKTFTRSKPPSIEVSARRHIAQAIATALICFTAACAGQRFSQTTAEHRIVGPKGYTVDWDLPETGTYWLPKESEDRIKTASSTCKAAVSVFVYHHLPRPPQYSYLGFKFEGPKDEAAKACLLRDLQAVPSLTVYPKRR